MSYTVFDTSSPNASATVVPNVLDALALVRKLCRDGRDEPIVAASDGWILSADELEDLVRS